MFFSLFFFIGAFYGLRTPRTSSKFVLTEGQKRAQSSLCLKKHGAEEEEEREEDEEEEEERVYCRRHSLISGFFFLMQYSVLVCGVHAFPAVTCDDSRKRVD